ncbi:MAG: tRNA pseudouridine(55) synthase TruB [Oleiphilaceae bacterium]|nr:tRNA pseudouridine(55) synthase TruB [Oleiphilaceae bacterium]
MARRRKGRAVHGVLLLDKPQTLTSNAALQKVRRAFSAQKAGHTGALDPLATGVLPICLGEATKFSRFLLDADKAYYTTAQLGVTRDTGDSDGNIVATQPVPELNKAALEQVLQQFRGDIQQVPSMYSALKHQGRPLYEWARKGITIDRPARPVTISLLTLDAMRADQLDLSVECSKGTYIRSLVEDIGEALGCGAHVSMLRRYKAGHFNLQDCHVLDEIQALAEGEQVDFAKLDALLLKVEDLLPDLPCICLKTEHSRSILNGQAVRISGLEKPGLVRVYVAASELGDLSDSELDTLASQLGSDETAGSASEGRFIFGGVAEADAEGWVKPKRLINFSDALS